jgi:hypothetical protein
MSRREERAQRRQARKRQPPPGGGIRLPRAVRRLVLPTIIALVAAGAVGALVFAVSQTGEEASVSESGAETDDSPDLPGQFFESQGREHLALGTVYPLCGDGVTEDCYASNPPTSGPHDPVPVQRGIYDDPQPKEKMIHNMEHAGVIIWYNCTDCDEVVDELKDIALDFLDDGKQLVMSPYPEMEPNTIALTGWTRLDKFSVDEFDEGRVRDFIETHECRFDPENFC